MSDTLDYNDKFDIAAYRLKIQKNPEYMGYPLANDVYVQESCILKEGDDRDMFVEEDVDCYLRQINYPTFYVESYKYFPNGNLEESEFYFSVDMPIKIWETYNQKGELVSSIDQDEGYEFTLEKVKAFGLLHDNNFEDNGKVSRGFNSKYQQNVWTLVWVERKEGEEPKQVTYILDAKKGETLETFQGPAPRVIY